MEQKKFAQWKSPTKQEKEEEEKDVESVFDSPDFFDELPTPASLSTGLSSKMIGIGLSSKMPEDKEAEEKIPKKKLVIKKPVKRQLKSHASGSSTNKKMKLDCPKDSENSK